MTDLQVGAKAPDFNFSPVTEGVSPPLAVKGSPFVVFFYPRADSPACTNEAVGFSQRLADFTARGVVVVGVSPDSPAKLARFRDKHGLTVSLVSDAQLAVIQRWGVWVEKSLYGRRFMGVERATFLVNSKGRIAQSWRRVRVPGHVEAVLDAVDALTLPASKKRVADAKVKSKKEPMPSNGV